MSAWFRPKKFGCGAAPVALPGGGVIATGVIAVAAAAPLILVTHGGQSGAWIAFFVSEAVVLALLWSVSRRHTEGEWRCRWGDR